MILSGRNKFILLLLVFVILLLGSGSWGLTESSEARYAEISREMLLSNDYAHPTLLGIKHYHKPPVTYYITTLGYRLFGVNEFGARFFLTIALLIQLVLVYKIALLLFEDRKAATASAIIYFSMPLVLVSARVLTTDPYLVLFVIWAIYFLLYFWKKRKLFSLYAFYIVLGIGVLTKGPAMLLPVGVFFLTWKVMNRERFQITWHSVLAGCLFILISVSWFAVVMAEDNRVLAYFINEQVIHRATGATSMHRAKPIWYYLLFLPLVGFPWVPLGLIMYPGKEKIREPQRNVILVLALTALLILLAYSLASSKLILYVLPMFPFVSLLLGYYFIHLPEKLGKGIRIFFLCYSLLLVFVIFLLPFAGIIGWNVLPGSLVALGLLASTLFIFRRKVIDPNQGSLLMSYCITLSLLLTFTLFSSQNPGKIKSFKPIVASASSGGQKQVANFFIYNMLLPSTAFYLDQPVITLVDDLDKVDRETEFERDETYKENLIDLRDPEERQHLKQLMREQSKAFLFQAKDSIPDYMKESVYSLPNKEHFGKYVLYY